MSNSTIQPFHGEKIRVGVVGARRGQSFARAAANDVTGLELVALCDTHEPTLRDAAAKYGGVAAYPDFDRFLAHEPMDAVVLANFYHQHAPLAIRALAAGKHVLSETACNKTLAEGVALCRAVERSKRVYMLAENYAYMLFAQEMMRLYRAGEIGQVLYAEGEYNHPVPRDVQLELSPGMNHWRHWLPSTYYCTHAMAPLMIITDTMPKSVMALSIAHPDG